MHVSEADLEPGDLVFFFAGISHVGIYIGNGLDGGRAEHRPEVCPAMRGYAVLSGIA